MISQRFNPRDISIGVITALPREFAATRAILRCHSKLTVNGREYRIGEIRTRSNDGFHVIALCCLTYMGNNEAAIATTLLRQDFPRVMDVLLCGIAGAVPNPSKPSVHVRLGDVVVTGEGGVVQYDFIRRLPFRTIVQPRTFNASPRLRQSAIALQADEEVGVRPWNRYMERTLADLLRESSTNTKWRRPENERDMLCEFMWQRPRDYLTFIGRCVGIPGRLLRYQPIPHPYDAQRVADQPRVFHGVIASGNVLLKNPRERNCLRDRFNARAVEMEGAGFAEAAYKLQLPFFVVRGTCDYCNPDKSDEWQHYAAIAAASFTLALLEATVLPSLYGSALEPMPTAPAHVANPDIGPQESNLTRPQVIPADAGAIEDYSAIVEEATMRRIERVQGSIDTWEYVAAIVQAGDLEHWITRYGHSLSSTLLGSAFRLLARVAMIKASRLVDEGSPLDLTEAEFYFAEARRVATS
jgi:nucleoside phosphorylase